MTLEATIERPAPEPAGMPWPPAGQKLQRSEARVASLPAELERQRGHMEDACMMAEELRGLVHLFKKAFCDEDVYRGDLTARSENADAARVVANCLVSMADRLHAARDLADASRRHALAEAAR